MRKLLLLFFSLGSVVLFGQEPMRVVRCDAVDYRSEIINIHVTPDNETYVATDKGVFRIFDLNLGEPLEVPQGQESLLAYPGGNALITWEAGALNEALGGVLSNDNSVAATYYDAESDELWVGTTGTGLYRLKTKPRLSVVETYDDRNSPLRSNYINTIHRDYRGTYWIGTQYGVMRGSGKRWELLERDFNIQSVATDSSNVWFLGNNLVGYVDRKGVWYPIELPSRTTEGRLKEIVFDQNGQLWIASEIITRYNLETQDFSVYGPAAYYTSEFASFMRVNADTAIWVGTEDKGLYLIEKASAMTVSLLVDREPTCAPDDPGGALQVRVKGGREPFRYKWSMPALTGNTADQLQPGLYTVEVVDATGKTKSATAELVDPRLTLTLEERQPESEPGANDGQAIVQVEGGRPGYRYAWDNGENLRVASQLSGGLHRVTVTDTKGCSAVGEITVHQDAAALVVSIETLRKPACAEANTGVLRAQVSGGRTPYRFSWNTGGQTQALDQVAEGTYRVTVTDSQGTTQEAEVLLIAPLPISIQTAVEAPASANQSNGRVSIQVSGGTGPYDILWDNGENTVQAQKLAGGIHQVTVTDANGCTEVADVNVSEDILPLSAQLKVDKPISCPGSIDGGLSISVNGGKPPYTYRWSSPALSGRQASNLPSGNYSVTVVDASGQETLTNLNLEDPEPLRAQVVPVAPASTGNEDGQAEVKVTGGQTPYSYQWDTGESQSTARQLAPGNHRVTITDAMGCLATAEIDVTEDILPLVLTLEQTQPLLCANDKNAGIQSKITGGKPPFTYRWSTGSTRENLDALGQGTYKLTIVDAVGTLREAEVTLKAPDPLEALAEVVNPASANAADGVAEVLVKGGQEPYTYTWDNGQTDPRANELAPGRHSVEITDANGCKVTAEVTIDENILPLAIVVAETQDVLCSGESTGKIQISVRGGKSPFQISWSNGADGASVEGLPAGTYSVTVTDAEGTQEALRVTLREPNVLVARTTVENPASTGGSDGRASVLVIGGTQPYQYNWDNGQDGAKASGFSPGVHQVTVTDANNCEVTAEVIISENILPLRVTLVEVKALSCAEGENGEIQSSVSGGKAPFRYSWSTGATTENLVDVGAGNYNLTVTDSEGTAQSARIVLEAPEPMVVRTQVESPASTGVSDGEAIVLVTGGTGPYQFKWDHGGVEAKATGLASGVHQVTVTDAKGCQVVQDVDLPENILPLQVTLEEVQAVTCAESEDGKIQVAISGGKGPFSYKWNTGVTTETLDRIGGGAFSVTVTDVLGTTQTARMIIEAPRALSLTTRAIEAASTDGQDGQATVQVTGGVAPYAFRWDNDEQEATAVALAPGLHEITVTDANGCEAKATVVITENILPLSLALDVYKPISCYGRSDGALSTQVEGGKGPYTYKWGQAALQENPSGLGPGIYTLTVTDNSGQSREASIELVQPDSLVLDVVAVTPSSGGSEADGKAKVVISGGTPDYEVRWSNGETNPGATRLDVGNQNVVVTDARGCEARYDLAITERMIPGLVAEKVEEGQTIQMESLRFEADSVTVNEGMLPILEELYQFLNANAEIKVEIGGHTNNIPPDYYCDELSTARAKAVADYLIEKGLTRTQVTYRGYGKRQPIATNETPEGRAKNQRVEIKILE